MRIIIVVIFVALFFVFELPFMGVMWIIGKFVPEKADLVQLRVVQWGFRVVLFLSGTKLVIHGQENVPKDEAVLYIGNHRSYWDIITTYSRCPQLTGYVAKKSVGKVPVLGMIMRRLHCLFIDREDMKQSLKVILQAIDQVKNGISVCIFPEGTRNKDQENPQSLLPFKDGSFKIASKSGCKIIPMAITGSADIFENHAPWIRRGTVTVTYGSPVVIKTLDKEDQKHIGAYMQGVISDMLTTSMTQE